MLCFNKHTQIYFTNRLVSMEFSQYRSLLQTSCAIKINCYCFFCEAIKEMLTSLKKKSQLLISWFSQKLSENKAIGSY